MANSSGTTVNGSESATNDGGGGGVGEIMLFGVRVVVDSFRKSVSMNNLSEYQLNQDDAPAGAAAAVTVGGGGGYASADDVVPNSSAGNRERKRGVPWTEEEHKRFLLGLQKVGKGDWRGISRNYVKTRTPTQVASHAQKYFLRKCNLNRRRRRSSLFDITTADTVVAPMVAEEQQINHQENTSAFPVNANAVVQSPVSVENLTLAQPNANGNLIRPMPAFLRKSMITNLNLNLKLTMDPSPLALTMFLASDPLGAASSSSRHSAFQVMSSFKKEDGNGVISVT